MMTTQKTQKKGSELFLGPPHGTARTRDAAPRHACLSLIAASAALGLCLCLPRPAITGDPGSHAAASRPNPRGFAGPVDRKAQAGRAITPRAGGAAGAAAPANRARAGGSWWGSLVSLAAVVAMIILGAKLWKKHGPLSRAGLPAEAIEVLGRRALDPRQSIYLIRLGSRILVLGAAPSGLSTLSEITDPIEVDLLAGSCRPPVEERAADLRSFAALFTSGSADDAATTPVGPFAALVEPGGRARSTEHHRHPEEAHA